MLASSALSQRDLVPTVAIELYTSKAPRPAHDSVSFARCFGSSSPVHTLFPTFCNDIDHQPGRRLIFAAATVGLVQVRCLDIVADSTVRLRHNSHLFKKADGMYVAADDNSTNHANDSCRCPYRRERYHSCRHVHHCVWNLCYYIPFLESLGTKKIHNLIQ